MRERTAPGGRRRPHLQLLEQLLRLGGREGRRRMQHLAAGRARRRAGQRRHAGRQQPRLARPRALARPRGPRCAAAAAAAAAAHHEYLCMACKTHRWRVPHT